MSKSKRELDIEIISNIDDDIIEKNSKRRFELFTKLAERRKKNKKIAITWISAAASLLLVVGIISILIPILGNQDPVVTPPTKQVPVYQGMTVSNEMPDIASLSAKQGGVMSQLLGNGKVYIGTPQLLTHNGIDQKDPYNRGNGNKLEDAVRDEFIAVEPDKNMYYAKKNQDIYITVHILNPDNFEILSFTLNGKKYSTYMFEEGSDMENLVLKVNIGEAEGLLEYTIDAIKYVDGEEIKDVQMEGDKTVKITVYPENQPLPTITNETVTYTDISFEVSVEDKLGLIDTDNEKLYTVLYDGETLVYNKEIKKDKTTVSFDSLTADKLYQYAIVGVYDALDGNGISAHILTHKAIYTPYVVRINDLAFSGRTLDFTPTWSDEYTGDKSFTSLAIYEGATLVAEFPTDTVEISEFDFGKSYILKAEYLFNGKSEILEYEFSTPKSDGLEFNSNGEISGIGSCTDTVLYLDRPIAAEAFKDNTAVKTVYTDSCVTYIGRNAFEGCRLEKLEISEGVKFIDDWAFKNGKVEALNIADLGAWCDIIFNDMWGNPHGTNPIGVSEKLYVDGILTTDLIIPQGVKSISFSAFMEAKMIESVTIPSGVTECGAYAFYGASSLSRAELPATLTRIEPCAFKDTVLAEISLPSGIQVIEDEVFCGCKFTSIVLPSTLKAIGDRAFAGTALKSLSIPSGVKIIGDEAFSGCAELRSLTLPSGIEELGDYVVRYCTSLEGNVYGNAKYLGTDTNDYFYLFAPTSTDISELSVHSSTKFIASRALESCSSLVNIELPSGLTNIQERAFRLCSSLENINIPSGIEEIGIAAFSGCKALATTAYGNAIYLGNADNDYVYLYKATDTGITSVDIHTSTKMIGYEAFIDCAALTSIQLPSGLTAIGNYAFSRCSGITEMEIPSSVIHFGDGVFSRTGLTSIPAGLTRITDSMFSGCTGLSGELVIPDSITRIGGGAFSGCVNIVSVVVPSSVTELGAGAFSGCSALKTATLSAKNIQGVTFRNCTALERITVTEHVEYLAIWVFYGTNSDIKAIVFENPESWKISSTSRNLSRVSDIVSFLTEFAGTMRCD
ncbi:MAG: leucine-rich repeat protein [Clostridia bacterium]|nr:leucine-rich repeat protein [Clostridia bacterium]